MKKISTILLSLILTISLAGATGCYGGDQPQPSTVDVVKAEIYKFRPADYVLLEEDGPAFDLFNDNFEDRVIALIRVSNVGSVACKFELSMTSNDELPGAIAGSVKVMTAVFEAAPLSYLDALKNGKYEKFGMLNETVGQVVLSSSIKRGMASYICVVLDGVAEMSEENKNLITEKLSFSVVAEKYTGEEPIDTAK